MKIGVKKFNERRVLVLNGIAREAMLDVHCSSS